MKEKIPTRFSFLVLSRCPLHMIFVFFLILWPSATTGKTYIDKHNLRTISTSYDIIIIASINVVLIVYKNEIKQLKF